MSLPQGCIWSLILFFLYTRKLYGLLLTECTIIQFADDIVILFRSKNPRRGLEICPEKTKLVLFNKLNLNSNDPIYNLKINDFFITPSLNVKFLGTILDHSFTFNDHFKYLSDKLRKTLNILKVLRGVWWGAYPYTLITNYDALIRSCLDYWSHIFTFENQKLFDRLEKIRNRTLRLAIVYRTSTLINFMLAE